MNSEIADTAKILQSCSKIVALTGAGISVESGIPDFRSAGGLWDTYPPERYATIDSFVKNPDDVWKMIFDLIAMLHKAKPNAGHLALARLEEMGILSSIITQNIDALHQKAGSDEVIEFHGTAESLVCIRCGARQSLAKHLDAIVNKKIIPRCEECDIPLKPDVIFFGEPVPVTALSRSREELAAADALIVAGTSAQVFPAAAIPQWALEREIPVIEINREATQLTSHATVSLRGSTGELLPALVESLLQ